MALVTNFFPEDNQKHLLVYYDPSIQTLNDGLRRLMRISNPILRYTQTIAIAHPTTDRSYEGHVTHTAVFRLSFPAECTMISGVRNNGGCRMVSYYRDPSSGYVREWTVTPTDMIRNVKGMELVVYTNDRTEIILTYEVYLFKPVVRSSL